MGIKTFTKQNLVVVCNHNVLHKNVQVCFDRIPPTKEMLVKLLYPYASLLIKCFVLFGLRVNALFL